MDSMLESVCNTWGEPTVIILCVSYNQDSTIAQGREKALARVTTFQTYRKLGVARAEMYKTVKMINIKCEKKVMKGDFDSQAKLGIF